MGVGRQFAIFLLALAPAGGQEIDTVIFGAPARQSSVVDEVSVPGERQAFVKLYHARQPEERKLLAEKFLSRFPASVLLAEVYEMAAKAEIDLNQYPAAFQHARESLRLMPERPLLLVPLAIAQLRQDLRAEAARSAAAALEYLDVFARPAAFTEAQWKQLEPQLKSSCHYVLGRVLATAALSDGNPNRRAQLIHARRELAQALTLVPADPDAAYLMTLVKRALGDSSQPTPAVAPGPPPKPPPAEFAGSEACKSCHPAQYANWRETGMARMLRPYRPEDVLGDFSGQIFEGAARMRRDKSGHMFELRSPDGSWTAYPVNYIIGSKWQQAYATRLPDGRIQVFPVQYSLLEGKWVNYWKLIDPPASPRADILAFSAMTPATNYQANCAVCHTSQWRAPDSARDAVHSDFREPGVNCEMCHGPSAAHVAEIRSAHPRSRQAIDPPVDFRRISNRDSVAICAQCHLQSAIHAASDEAGPHFFPVYRRRPLQEFSRRAFYGDGRLRETTFIVEAFTRSACYRSGQASCASCHNPHAGNAASNRNSLKFAPDSDQMCLQCHAALARNPRAHTRHDPASPAGRCVSCHMPRITNSLLFRARSHQIDDKPDGAMLARFGPQESPNACLLCHQEKGAEWVQEQLRSW